MRSSHMNLSRMNGITGIRGVSRHRGGGSRRINFVNKTDLIWSDHKFPDETSTCRNFKTNGISWAVGVWRLGLTLLPYNESDLNLNLNLRHRSTSGVTDNYSSFLAGPVSCQWGWHHDRSSIFGNKSFRSPIDEFLLPAVSLELAASLSNIGPLNVPNIYAREANVYARGICFINFLFCTSVGFVLFMNERR